MTVEFCKACSIDTFGEDRRHLVHVGAAGQVFGYAPFVLCAGCGMIQVDAEGCCLSAHCVKTGFPGHGAIPIKGIAVAAPEPDDEDDGD